MSESPKIVVYGGSGYTGKLVAECLAERNMPFYFSGRNQAKLESSLKIVEERLGRPCNEATIVQAANTREELVPLFEKVEVVINVAGPFMQLAWPVIEACLETNCHYLDTTGEQDFTIVARDKYGKAFAEKNLLLSPANSYMWVAGALAAEVVLETEGVDTLDITYQINNALPSQASTRSFLRMVNNPQYYIKDNEMVEWQGDRHYTICVPHLSQPQLALPWSGGCEPVWYEHDDRVRNLKVLTAFGDEIIEAVVGLVHRFNEESQGMTQEQKEELTNNYGDEMTPAEPPKDSRDIHRTVITCIGQGRQVTTVFPLSLNAPYTFTGEICAESASRLLNGDLKAAGFQSATGAFGHRELLEHFHKTGYTNLPD
ncbi:saccharopine dehydrogenase NADP-binding domain-containing protein [Spongiibacter nanhainus]|uniref:Saccharopine dehydrogenase NADP-binding domain-containing protein n=1 Tax=Spongiibacter nanhainus TaxID=2794344 RepID=A0A7T4R230_9GAMM|nr:DUF5938 domain-containing protein [Spongiibacter nanhainus]QQD19000.1 saccharopine dehydrogenase NADP-binding domain-containing protein [Spongiibacter nanhainus]